MREGVEKTLRPASGKVSQGEYNHAYSRKKLPATTEKVVAVCRGNRQWEKGRTRDRRSPKKAPKGRQRKERVIGQRGRSGLAPVGHELRRGGTPRWT